MLSGSARSRLWVAMLSMAAAGAAPPVQASTSQRLGAFEALRSGRYAEAARLLRGPALDGDAQALAGWVAALRETGDHAGAIQAAGEGRRRGVDGAEALLGVALLGAGRIAEARAALEAGAGEPGSPGAVARVELGILEYQYGDRPTARLLFSGFIDYYNAVGAELDAAELAAVGRALVHLSRWRYEYAHDALRALDEAVAAGPLDHTAQLAIGELFLERYDPAQATEAFRTILAENPSHARAHLGLARAARLEGRSGALEHLGAALEADSNLVGARTLLARLHLLNGDRTDALEEVTRALDTNPADLEAMGTLAAIRHAAGDSSAFAAVVDRIRKTSPAAKPFVALAEIAAARRKYADAAGFALSAAAADSNSWAGWGLAGLNLVRLGRVAEGREHLEKAFAGDPFNLWFKNTLDLLDTFAEYRTVETEHFRLVLHESEAALLAPYMASVAERAYREMAQRYGYEPPEPIRVEVFPRHADFSVRTVGLVGLGALGVSFGPALAMDSPAARAKGEFNWASTLWHEIAHSFHMGVSENEVPRWFSEGLAVHEQRKGDPTWGRRPGVSFARSLASGTLRPVGELDRGFSHPRHPAEVSDTYYQASLVFELIESRHGFPAIVGMLSAYRDGADDEEAFQRVLGVALADFERDFSAYLAERFRTAAAAVGEDAVESPPGGLAAARAAVAQGPGRFEPRMTLGRALFDDGRFEDAARHFETATQLFAEYGGADGPHWYLGRIREHEGDLAAASRHYRRLLLLNESHYDARAALARVLAQAGDSAAAAGVLRDVAYIHPYGIADHEQAAGFLEAAGRLDEAEVERRAVLALDPVDKAAAHFRLAVVLRDKGDHAGARRAVLAALELAPNYDEALELLLELRRGRRER